MEILGIWEYNQRLMIVTVIEKRYQIFYRSSGLAGYDSKGEVLPAGFVNERRTFSMVYGWIPKYYYKKSKFQDQDILKEVAYRTKRPEDFPEEIREYMLRLKAMDLEVLVEGVENEPVGLNEKMQVLIDEYEKENKIKLSQYAIA